MHRRILLRVSERVLTTRSSVLCRIDPRDDVRIKLYIQSDTTVHFRVDLFLDEKSSESNNRRK